MDVELPSTQAILIISFNIFRVLCRRYGLYLFFGFVILVFQGLSGYYILYYGVDKNLNLNSPVSSQIKYSENIILKNVNENHISYTFGIREERNIKNNILSDIEDNVNKAHHIKANNPSKGQLSDINGATFNFGFPLPCQITNKEVISALQRSKTIECKKKIAEVSCQVENGTFYPSRLVSYCPTHGHIRGKPLGCFKDNLDERILKGHMVSLKKNSPYICADICFQRGYTYSGVEYSKECFCGNNEVSIRRLVSESECNMKCVGSQNQDMKCGGYLRVNIFETGLAKLVPKPVRKPSNSVISTVRIAYILTVNGRSLRQVYRLFKALFHYDHYFIFHVDSRQHFLYRELLKLEESFDNVILSRKRFSSIWGGSSLLDVLLHCMEEILKKEWIWDFVINLSESDFPIKTNKALVDFLSVNKERNFLKSHGHDTNKFLQKQGLDRTFLECEMHMWRIGERKLPLGIRIDGGSDWVCLNRQFVEYIILSKDMLVDGLKKVFSFTLLPGESFFHTVLRNSEYCQTFTDNNLHVTNWKRKLGCRCQYKHIVDWCGCSPNDFTPKDWIKLEASKNRDLFFARKFEAVKSLEAINNLDEWLYGAYDQNGMINLQSYWENIYHYEDPPTNKDDVGLTFFHSIMRLITKYINELFDSKATEQSQRSSDRNIISVLPSQAHTYHAEDVFKGIIVEFLARTKLGTGITFEVLTQPNLFFEKAAATDLSQRILKMEINSNFDLKEQMFRNFGGYLGPSCELSVALWLTPVELDEYVDKEDGNQEIEVNVVLVDPLQAVASSIQIKFVETEEVVSHVFSLTTPLRPGHWTAVLIYKEQIIASLVFTILPLQFAQGRQISISEGRKLHSGPSKPYSEVENNFLDLFEHQDSPRIRSSLYPGNKTLIKMADEMARVFGPDLSTWIDELIHKSYRIQEVCYVSNEEIPLLIKKHFSSCSNTLWSSHSPDPKSNLTEIDQTTGRMREYFRVTPIS